MKLSPQSPKTEFDSKIKMVVGRGGLTPQILMRFFSKNPQKKIADKLNEKYKRQSED
jgi:hypothetical protein